MGDRYAVRCRGDLRERALRAYEHHGVWKINDFAFHDGAGGEVVLDRAENPAHPAVGGEEGDLIADPEPEVTPSDQLERTGEASTATHCQQVVRARVEP